MKREEADYMQDMSSKQTERIKVSEIDIIVNMINGKPYYEIKYKKSWRGLLPHWIWFV